MTLVEAAQARAGTRPLVLGGFSQGGMLACDTLLRSSLPIAALALFSSSRIAFENGRRSWRAGASPACPCS